MVTLREEGAATATGAEPSAADCAAASCGKGQCAATVRSNTVIRTPGPLFGVLLTGLWRVHGISVLSPSMRHRVAKNVDPERIAVNRELIEIGRVVRLAFP